MHETGLQKNSHMTGERPRDRKKGLNGAEPLKHLQLRNQFFLWDYIFEKENRRTVFQILRGKNFRKLHVTDITNRPDTRYLWKHAIPLRI